MLTMLLTKIPRNAIRIILRIAAVATYLTTLAEGKTLWGPVIHWNTFLQRYMMILNRTKDTTWATEGIYLSFSNGKYNTVSQS